MPYVPATTSPLSHRKHPYRYHIAYTLQLRGDDACQTPYIVLYGAPYELVRDACLDLYRNMNGKVHDLLLSREHSCRYRNGKCYWRIAVCIKDLDEKAITTEGFATLFAAYLRRLCNCTLRRYRVHDFINL